MPSALGSWTSVKHSGLCSRRRQGGPPRAGMPGPRVWGIEFSMRKGAARTRRAAPGRAGGRSRSTSSAQRCASCTRPRPAPASARRSRPGTACSSRAPARARVCGVRVPGMFYPPPPSTSMGTPKQARKCTQFACPCARKGAAERLARADSHHRQTTSTVSLCNR